MSTEVYEKMKKLSITEFKRELRLFKYNQYIYSSENQDIGRLRIGFKNVYNTITSDNDPLSPAVIFKNSLGDYLRIENITEVTICENVLGTILHIVSGENIGKMHNFTYTFVAR